MAFILPDTPLVTTSPEIARLHRLLKQLPDATFAVWHRLTIHPEPGPEFWILHCDKRALWLKVCSLTSAGVQSFTQAGLFTATTLRPVETEHRALEQFAQHHFSTTKTQPLQRLPAAVIFPNLTELELETIAPLAHRPPLVEWASKEMLTPTTFGHWLDQHLGPPLSDHDVARLRQAITPEVVVPTSFTVREPIARRTAAEIAPFLLDYDQERALKSDLDLSDEARATANNFGLRLINGVAGSGKSLVIVYRAKLLRQLYPHKKILGLTHNRPLIHDLKARYQTLNPEGAPVEWLTFNQWCRRLWPKQHEFVKPISHPAKRKLLTTIWHAQLADTPFSEQWLTDELDWCKDRLLFSREDYLAADRSGRGFALTEAQRHKMYTAFESYQAELNRRGQMDWGDVPRQIWRWAQSGEVRLPQYDVILVDEAQFFAPLWFELIKRALLPGLGHLFLVADPTQGFLKRKQSWTASGLEVRGRVHRLKKSYRTTREIMDFATLLYRQRVPHDDDDITLPDLANMPSGAIPQVIALTSEQDEITRVVNEIEALLKQGLPKRHLLVIHTEWQGRNLLLERLRSKFGPTMAVDPKDVAAGSDAIRVCTLNAVTGLESPIVFVVGARALFEQEQSVRLSDEERTELIRDNTRKLYMAITRAGQRVVMTYVGELPGVLRSMKDPVPFPLNSVSP